MLPADQELDLLVYTPTSEGFVFGGMHVDIRRFFILPGYCAQSKW
jgi:hypothetical protein